MRDDQWARVFAMERGVFSVVRSAEQVGARTGNPFGTRGGLVFSGFYQRAKRVGGFWINDHGQAAWVPLWPGAGFKIDAFLYSAISFSMISCFP